MRKLMSKSNAADNERIWKGTQNAEKFKTGDITEWKHCKRKLNTDEKVKTLLRGK